jgi:hypothetical protein
VNPLPATTGPQSRTGQPAFVVDQNPASSILDPASDRRPPAPRKRRRTGKVACLPQAVRDQLNALLDDGLPYHQIIAHLGPDGAALTLNNISEWKTGGGYDEYLDDKFWRQEMRARQETFTKMLAGSDPIQLPEAGLQLAATGACELLRDLCTLDDADATIDPDKFVRVSNALARLSRSILVIQQYRDTAARNKALELKHLETDREFVENERTAVLDRTDDLFGFKSAARLRAEFASAIAQGSVARASSPASSEASPPQPTPVFPNASNEPPSPQLKAPSSPSETQNSSHPSEQSYASAQPSIENQNSKIQNEPDQCSSVSICGSTSSSIENQNSKIQNPQEHCYNCAAPLPSLLPTGQRPHRACRSCNSPLHPPGTPFDHCPFCDTANPILADNQRPASECRRCGNVLPPPGQRFVTACPACGLKLRNVTNLGKRISDRCPDCRAQLPLLEPSPTPPTPFPWSPTPPQSNDATAASSDAPTQPCN